MPIVARLRDLGCDVRDISQVGDGKAGDVIVGILGRDYQVEIKSLGGKLSVEQEEDIRDWKGQRKVVLWTVDQCETWVNDIRRRLFAEFRIK